MELSGSSNVARHYLLTEHLPEACAGRNLRSLAVIERTLTELGVDVPAIQARHAFGWIQNRKGNRHLNDSYRGDICAVARTYIARTKPRSIVANWTGWATHKAKQTSAYKLAASGVSAYRTAKRFGIL
jgi:hypothetical protein